MTTGNFTDWTGNIADIGAIYPFVGSEYFLVFFGFVFWIGWHVMQHKIENNDNKDSTSHNKK